MDNWCPLVHCVSLSVTSLQSSAPSAEPYQFSECHFNSMLLYHYSTGETELPLVFNTTSDPYKHLPSQHLKDEDAQSPPIHSPPMPFALDNFRSQVLRGSTESPGPGGTKRDKKACYRINC
ncbi:hypothetical protein AMECASPLE_036142 [Ameca splendens]|uniref:Uncharacterized protein n=1 Tax=Ameca splendens TaxID=208324 RepID=A0ABV1A2X4_9TELE